MTAIFVSTSAVSQQNKIAYDLMDSMIEASNSLNYSGLVTYEKAGRLKTSKMLHLIRDDMTFEQLTHLDGPAGQISWVTGCLPTIGVFWQQGVNVLIVWSVVVEEVGQEFRQVQDPIKCP